MDTEQVKALRRRWDEYIEIGMPLLQARMRSSISRIPKPVHDSANYLEHIEYDENETSVKSVEDDLSKTIHGMRLLLDKSSASLQQFLIRSDSSISSRIHGPNIVIPNSDVVDLLSRYDKQLLLNKGILEQAGKVKHKEEATLLWSLWKYQPYI